jgi:hypothetical protein
LKNNKLISERDVDIDVRQIHEIAEVISGWYVRRDSKFYDIERSSVKLSKEDVQRACLHRFEEEAPHLDTRKPDELREGFRMAIDSKHADARRSIPVWDGALISDPGNPASRVALRGAVSLNLWREPSYRRLRDAEPELGVAEEFFDAVFTREAEREKFIDWLAWSLQNEAEKPAWSPFLYSASKGSGKSTLCQLVSLLFGERNSVTLNSVDKLTSRFNSPVLTSKLVICEEVNLRPDSKQGNALKTFITEEYLLSERKGIEAEQVRQRCCFIFTSNHLPLWIEPHDRRYYLIEIDHDGHASGTKAKEFADLVGRLREAMKNEEFLASVYRALLARRFNNSFSAKTLNVVEDATPLSRRVHGASELATVTLMRESLAEKKRHAVPEADVARIIAEDLRGNPNQSKHLMSQLGWTKCKAKWGGKDYARAVWIEESFRIERGKLCGPSGYSQSLTDHIRTQDEGELLPEFKEGDHHVNDEEVY